MKGIFLFFIYALTFLVAHIYALDLNLNDKNDIYHVHTNMMIIVKKEKILVTWNKPIPVDDPQPDTFTLEILTNHTVDSVTNRHICAGSYVIADNITDYQYKWKAIKLQKYDMYTFLVRANGYDKFGLSHELYYAPSLYKFIKNRRGNSTFNIPYKYSSKDIKSMDVPLDPNSPDYQSGVDSNENIGDDGIRTTQRELKNTKFNAFVVSTVVSTTMLVAFIILAVYSNQKNNKNKGEGSFFFGKFKSSTCSISEEYVEEYSDCKSDTASSVMVREQLKRKALEIERKKLMDSINERSTNGSSNNYESEVMTNSGVTNSDYSFHGMEVMTFSHQMKPANTENQNKETKIEVDIVNITQPNDTDSVSDTTSNNDFTQSTTINVNP